MIQDGTILSHLAHLDVVRVARGSNIFAAHPAHFRFLFNRQAFAAFSG